MENQVFKTLNKFGMIIPGDRVIVGLSGVIIPVPFAEGFRFDMIVSGVAAAALLLFCLPKKKLPRFAGAIMLLGYVLYFMKIW